MSFNDLPFFPTTGGGTSEGSGSATFTENEIVIIEIETFDEDIMTGTISEESLKKIEDNAGTKPIYLNSSGVFIPYFGGGMFAVCTGVMNIIVALDTDAKTGNFTGGFTGSVTYVGDLSSSTEGVVRYDKEQTLTNEDKAKARANIGTTDGTWASMPDKPFGEDSWILEWDGVPKEPFIDLSDMGAVICKVGEVKTKEEIIGATCKINVSDGTMEVVVAQSEVEDIVDGCFMVHFTDAPLAALLFAVSKPGTYNVFGFDRPFESEGIWFVKVANDDAEYCVTSLSKSEIKKIDKIFLPDNILTEQDKADIVAAVLAELNAQA